jgi:SAM-dependent methyltransferase
MKEKIWQLLVLLCSFVPRSIRGQLINLLLSVSSKKANSADLLALLNSHDQVLYHIDEAAIKIEGGIHPKHRLMQYHDFFVNRINPGEKVLDVGCGIGIVALAISKKGALVTGIDYDHEKVSIARNQNVHPNLTFIHGDVTVALPDARFDIIVLSNVLEHIEFREIFLTSLVAAFAPKKILIRVPMINKDWLVPLKKELGVKYYSDPTHFTEYTTESFTGEMSSSGLQIAYIKVNWGEIWAEVLPRD